MRRGAAEAGLCVRGVAVVRRVFFAIVCAICSCFFVFGEP
jgi:hypothetical protein